MESIVEIVGKLINSNIAPNISGIEENNEIIVVQLPDTLTSGKYLDVFKSFIKLRRCMIPLAIIRSKQPNMNEIPVVLINP
jgi:hypothetical protein